jgi:hypothetical protein
MVIGMRGSVSARRQIGQQPTFRKPEKSDQHE